MNKQELQNTVTHVTINSQVLLNRLSDLNAERLFSKSLKLRAKQFLSELIKVESKWFDKFDDKEENSTDYVYNVYDEFIEDVSSVPIYEMKNISIIIEAYRKDPKSIEGICRKILR